MSFTEITKLLTAASEGDRIATDQLFSAAYGHLRRLADIHMSSEPPQTLQSTALVHEVWMKLFGSREPPQWNDSQHFFAAAAQAMRRILVDSAKARNRQKRGGGRLRFQIREDDLLFHADEDILALDEALEQLRELDPKKAELVCLRYFAGLTNKQAARQLEISVTTAERYWVFAKAWLRAKIDVE